MNLRWLNALMAIVVVGIGLFSCQSEEFKATEDGYEYKYITRGDGELPEQGEIIAYNMKYVNEKDSVLFESTADTPALVRCDSNQWNNTGPLFKAFKRIQVGDSILVKIPTKTLFAESFRAAVPPSLDPEGNITFQIGATKIMTEQELQDEAMAKSAEQLEDDIDIIENYLAENEIDAQTTESGLRYVIEEQGSGEFPQPGDSVMVHYTGMLIDGTKFDSSLDRGNPFEFVLGRGMVIQGWDEGIALLKPGGKGTLYIPSPLAYGERGAGGMIPPNAVLQFDVELIEIN
jgi:FKBP-type peptidyl-prolyl cis-trans isomerase